MRRGLSIIGLVILAVVLLPQAADAMTTRSLSSAINQGRRSLGAPLLRRDARLDAVARRRAAALEKALRLNHASSTTLRSYLRQAGYRTSRYGELLGADFIVAKTLVRGWTNSLQHRPILGDKRFKKMGIAVIKPTNRQAPYVEISVVILAGRSIL